MLLKKVDIDDGKSSDKNKKNNVYSSKEMILIRWINHILKHKMIYQNIKNFGEDLKDGRALACLLETYISPEKSLLGKIKIKNEKGEKMNLKRID